jgi:hypothetical protein
MKLARYSPGMFVEVYCQPDRQPKADCIARDIVIGATVGRAVHSAGAALVSAMGETSGDAHRMP